MDDLARPTRAVARGIPELDLVPKVSEVSEKNMSPADSTLHMHESLFDGVQAKILNGLSEKDVTEDFHEKNA